MPHRRKVKKGSFGGHFDELVDQFPELETKPSNRGARDRKQKEKLDVHAALFEQAWRLDRTDG
ncbi:hypothetical protein [Sphingomonas sp. URHD0057]|uniref:hypothetical protein n=1 Tax=Sphingomonas sp. URHD0057 TaxID=1380389 RepID=UPI00048C5221|nr:hypothetical protein [Sphingomonas sp. URHD0057]